MAATATRKIIMYIDGKPVENSLASMEQAVKRLTKELKETEVGTQKYEELRKKIVELKNETNKYREDLDTAQQKADKLRDKLMRIGAGLGGFTQVWTMFKNIVNTLRQTAEELAKMDDKMGLVMKTTGMTKPEVKELNDEFKKIDTRTAREQLNQLAYEAGKLGYTTKNDILNYVKAADQINIALGDVLGQDAMLQVAKMTSIFAKDSQYLQSLNLEEQLIAVGSVINELGKTSTANEEKITHFIGRLSGFATQVGMTIDQVAGYASVFDQKMQNVELSATALQRIMGEMIKKQQEYANIAGLTLEEYQKLINTDFNAALKKVLMGFNGAGGMQSLVPIFSEIGLDGQRATQAISALTNAMDELNIAQETANKAMLERVSVQSEYDTMNNTQQALMEKAGKIFTEMKIELGETLYPVIIKLISTSNIWLKSFAKIAKYITDSKILLTTIAGIIIVKITTGLLKIIKNTKLWTTVENLRMIKEQTHLIIKNTLERDEIKLKLQQLKIEFQQEKNIIVRHTLAQKIKAERAKELALTTAINAAEHSIKQARKNISYTSIITALAVVLSIIVSIAKKANEIKALRAQADLDIIKEQTEANHLFEALSKTNEKSERRAELMQIINEKYGDYLKNLVDENGNLLNIAKAHEIVNEKIRENILLKYKAEGEEKIREKNKKDINKQLQKILGFNEKTYGNELSQELQKAIIEKVQKITQNNEFKEYLFEGKGHGELSQMLLTDKGKKEFNEIYKKITGEEIKIYIDFWGNSIPSVIANIITEFGQLNDELEKNANAYGLSNKYISEENKLLTEQTKIYNQLLEANETWKSNKEVYKLSKNEEKLGQRFEIVAGSPEKDFLKTLENNIKYIDNLKEEAIVKYYDYFRLNTFPNISKATKEELQKTKAEIHLLIYKTEQEIAKKFNYNKHQNLNEKVEALKRLIGDIDYKFNNWQDPNKNGNGVGNKIDKIKDKWEEILKKIDEVNKKYENKEDFAGSKEKQKVVNDYEKLIQEAKDYWKWVESLPAHQRKLIKTTKKEVEKTIHLLYQQMWDETEKVDKNIRKKAVETSEKLIRDMELKLEKLRTRVNRKNWIKLRVDIAEIDTTWQKEINKIADNIKPYLQKYLTPDEFANVDTSYIENLATSFKECSQSWETMELDTIYGKGLNQEELNKLTELLQMIIKFSEAKNIDTLLLMEKEFENILRSTLSTGRKQWEETNKQYNDTIEAIDIIIEKYKKEGKSIDQLIATKEKLLQKQAEEKEIAMTGLSHTISSFFGISNENWADWEMNWQDNLSKMVDTFEAFHNQISDLWGNLSQIARNNMEKEIEEYEKKCTAETDLLDYQLEHGIVSQQYYDARKQKLEEEKDKKIKELRKEQYKREKAQAIAEALIQGAVGIARVWAQSGVNVILGAVMTALMAANTAAQVAVISSQPDPYAKGGYINKEKIILAGEEGQEWVASNKLLKDKKTAPIIHTLESYQRGETSALEELNFRTATPNTKNLSNAAKAISRNFALTQNNNQTAINNQNTLLILEEMIKLNKYLSDPKNRQATISKKIQLQSETEENYLRNLASLK